MIYPAPGVPVGEPPRGLQEVTLATGDSRSVHGWHNLARKVPPGRPAVVFFHGNGENLETLRHGGLFERLAGLEVPFLAIDYPGYGRSSGSASEASTRRAAAAALDWLAGEAPERPRVAAGWSLGAAVALRLAGERAAEVDGVIALSPWTTMAEVAASHYPSWLVGALLRERYDSLAAAEAIAAPALVVHGLRDRLIPSAHGERIDRALGDRARWVPVPEAGHNDLLSREVVWREMTAFLARVAR